MLCNLLSFLPSSCLTSSAVASRTFFALMVMLGWVWICALISDYLLKLVSSASAYFTTTTTSSFLTDGSVWPWLNWGLRG